MPTPANALTMAIWDEIQSAFPGRFRFTSGWRSAAHNAQVGGVANSYHLTGQAADFVPINGQYPAGEFEAIAALVAPHGYEVKKHNAGSGLHYHIEPNGYHNLGHVGTVTVNANEEDNSWIYIAGLVALALIL